MYVSSRQGYKPPVKSTGRGKKYSHFASLKYCNGAETFYTYDPQRRRLQNLTVNSGGNTIMDNAYTYDAVSNVLSVVNGASVPQSGKAGGQMAHTYTYDALYRLVGATGTYTGADNKTASYTLAMGYDNMHRITSKRQILTQNNVQFNGSLNAGYDLTYKYGTDTGKKFQLANVKDVNYRTEETPSESENVNNNHAYEYDANGNLVYVNTSRTKKDGIADEKTAERKLKWDEENRLLSSDDNGFVTNYWYDADGERTVKTSGESDQVYVNSEFAGGRTNTAKFSLYVSPYLVANQGGRYTKHIYIGSQRVVSKIGDFDSYGSDPRRIQYAGSETDGLSVDYKVKYTQQLQVIKDNYATFAVPYNGEDNNDYVDGKGFCCNDGSLEAAQTRALARAAKNNFQEGDTYEKLQFYYHPDHLGSSSYITNLDGEVVQHIEYVPFGEVFVEERNNIWNTPYLFNAKEFDEETGLYYYGARYYEPRLSLWMSVDPLQEKYPNISTYCYAANNPIKFIDSDGRKLLFASGTTEAFKQKFRAAIMYLHEHNADGIIAQIDKSSTIIYITERVGEASAFSKTKKTIYWDPNMGVLTSSDKKMSPVAVLNHEADHTLQYLKNPDKFAQDSKTLDPDYDDKEEMRVITGSEQKTALALGEISAGEVTRTDHIGIPYITKSPTTTEAKDGKIPKNPFVMDEIVISVPKSKNVNPNNDNNETDNK